MNAKVVRITGLGVLLAAGSALTGCLEKEEFPDQPILTFKELDQRYELNSPNDTITSLFFYVTVNFTDGDGDIGLDAADTVYSPFGPGEAHYFNYYTQIQKRMNGEWADIRDPWRYRMKRITPTGQDPTLNGEITVRMGPIEGDMPFPNPDLFTGDTLQVTVRLEDRSLHISNTVISDTFLKQ